MQDLNSFLSELPLFRSFSTAQLETLKEKSELKTYAPCGTIIKFGQPGKFLGVIIDGKAEAVITEETGKRRIGVIKQGDVIGEMSLLTGEPTSADVIALEKCQLLLIPQDVFSTVLVANPGAMMVLARTLT
jgi:acetate kinase